jgi:hypothetical protein
MESSHSGAQPEQAPPTVTSAPKGVQVPPAVTTSAPDPAPLPPADPAPEPPAPEPTEEPASEPEPEPEDIVVESDEELQRQATVAALREERRGYVLYGVPAQVEAVDAEIERLGG